METLGRGLFEFGVVVEQGGQFLRFDARNGQGVAIVVECKGLGLEHVQADRFLVFVFGHGCVGLENSGEISIQFLK